MITSFKANISDTYQFVTRVTDDDCHSTDQHFKVKVKATFKYLKLDESTELKAKVDIVK